MVYRLIEENQNHPEILNINCVDPLNRSALIAAIENENIELIKLLLELGIEVKVNIIRSKRISNACCADKVFTISKTTSKL